MSALTAFTPEIDVQINLDGIPLAIKGVTFDERRGVIFLRPYSDEVPDALRKFVAAVTMPQAVDRQEHAVRHNAHGHYELLQSHE